MIIAQMVGRSLDELFPHVPHQVGEPVSGSDELLGGRGTPANLVVRRGQSVGDRRASGRRPHSLLRALSASTGGLGPDPIAGYSGGHAPPAARIAQGPAS